MKPTESTASPQVLKKTQPEEFDLVILGGGTPKRSHRDRQSRGVALSSLV
jgi:hypothetical protein